MLSARAQKLLELKCGELKITPAEQSKFVSDAMVQQATSGIKGAHAAAGYTIRGYFELFRNRVKATQDAAVEVINACDLSDDLDAIPGYIDAKIAPFLTEMHAKVIAISSAPYSKAEPNLAAVYVKLKADFDFRAGLAIVHQKKEKPMSKSYHVHGPNLGQVGDGNTQNLKVNAENINTASGSGDVNIAPKAEKSGVMRYLVYPLIVGVLLALLAVLIKKYWPG